MNSRQLQLAIELAETRNFSQAAEQMNMTQSAFSKQIISLENELGVKLFDRTVMPVTLTPAGEFFIPKARKMLFDEEQMLKMMDRYKSGENGKLHVGVSPFRSLYLMPGLVKELKKEFPFLQIVLSEYGRTRLNKELSDGVYDFAVMNLPVDEGNYETIPLEKDTMVIAVPDSLRPLLEDHDGSSGEIQFSQCRKIPFIILSQGQEMRQLFDMLCNKYDVYPPIQAEVVGVTTAWEMVCAGVAATLIPKQFIRQSVSDLPLSLFPIRQDGYDRQPAVVMRRGQYVSPYAQFAIDYLTRNRCEL